MLCHYISILNDFWWFPITYIYRRNITKFELFNRLISLRHFEKVKNLFNVKTVKELQEKLMAVKTAAKNPQRIGYSNSFDCVIPIYQLIEIEKIGTIR